MNSIMRSFIEKDLWTFERLPLHTDQKIECFKYLKSKGNKTLPNSLLKELEDKYEEEKGLKGLEKKMIKERNDKAWSKEELKKPSIQQKIPLDEIIFKNLTKKTVDDIDELLCLTDEERSCLMRETVKDYVKDYSLEKLQSQ